MYYGDKKIIDVNYGGTPIKKAYYGSQLVWEKSTPIIIEQYVDLGLPSGIKWAKYNLGATYEYYNGNYYDVSDYIVNIEIPSPDGSSSTSEWSFIDPAIDVLIRGRRTPRLSEWEELMENTTVTLEVVEVGVKTYYCAKCTGSNGNYILIRLNDYMTDAMSTGGIVSTLIFELYRDSDGIKWDTYIAYTDGGLFVNRPVYDIATM